MTPADGHGADARAELLRVARRLHAVGSTGLHYVRAGSDQHQFDAQRYAEVVALAADLLALAAADPSAVATLRGALAVEPGHATPKLDVRGVVVRGDHVLLCRELLDDGRWTLPGGWADPGEPPSVAVTREVREETGLATEARAVLALFDRERHNTPPSPFATWKLFVECEEVGGELLARTDETADARFWPVDALPVLSTSRVTADQVRRCHALCRDPGGPRVALFD